jgi:hypothetical protein
MFELQGTNFEKGTFTLRLAKSPPWWARPFVALGPVRGRLVAWAIIMAACFGTFFRQPGRLFYDQGWISSSEEFLKLQTGTTWSLFFIGLIVFLLVIFLRRETLELSFDRTSKDLHYVHCPMGAKNPVREGRILFQELQITH